jgi:hypothetical protein
MKHGGYQCCDNAILEIHPAWLLPVKRLSLSGVSWFFFLPKIYIGHTSKIT